MQLARCYQAVSHITSDARLRARRHSSPALKGRGLLPLKGNPGSAISSISGTTTYFFPRGLRHREIGRRLELEIHVHVVLGGHLEHFVALAAHQLNIARA